MAAVFNNQWIYTTNTSAPGLIPVGLPSQWTDPVTGISYSSLNLLSESELNVIGWYQAWEDKPIDPITEYQTQGISSVTFDSQTKRFTVVYVYNYRPLSVVRQIKTFKLEQERKTYIEGQLNNIPDIRKWVAIYKAVGKLINHLTPLVPAIQNDAYLQGLLNKITNLNTQDTAFDDKMTQVETETDIPTIIAI